MISKPDKNKIRQKRHRRVRGKLSGTADRPRLNVFRSNTGIYAQVIDDVAGVTLASASTLDKEVSKGTKLVLAVGKSHPDEVEAPEGITFELPNPTTIVISGISKEVVGQTAAYVRSLRSPEPYKGKGIRYVGEYVRLKEGKTGK